MISHGCRPPTFLVSGSLMSETLSNLQHGMAHLQESKSRQDRSLHHASGKSAAKASVQSHLPPSSTIFRHLPSIISIPDRLNLSTSTDIRPRCGENRELPPDGILIGEWGRIHNPRKSRGQRGKYDPSEGIVQDDCLWLYGELCHTMRLGKWACHAPVTLAFSAARRKEAANVGAQRPRGGPHRSPSCVPSLSICPWDALRGATASAVSRLRKRTLLLRRLHIRS